MRRLVLIHGRSQQRKDKVALQAEWLDALHAGLAKAGIEATIPAQQVEFPYYGDVLYDIDQQLGQSQAITAGDGDSASAAAAEQEFLGQVVAEIATQKAGVTDEAIRAAAGGQAIEAGPLNWPWVLATLRVLDTLPGVSQETIKLVTHDVWTYLHFDAARDAVDTIVRGAMSAEQESVVVAHSLGTVVAYNILRHEAYNAQWQVPEIVTVGCPLGISAIVGLLRPLQHPAGVGDWFNAFDRRDTVALFPLDSQHFPITPAVENYADVNNPTSNRHGISGYLSDPKVAEHIYTALTV